MVVRRCCGSLLCECVYCACGSHCAQASQHDDVRRIAAQNEGGANAAFGTNRMSNTKYTVWNFIPKNLMEQVRSPSNEKRFLLFFFFFFFFFVVTNTGGCSLAGS